MPKTCKLIDMERSTQTFFVLSTVRSRSAWVSNFLTTPTTWCGHDCLAETGGSFRPPEAFFHAGAVGSDVTAYAEQLEAKHPRARFAALVREPASIARSLTLLGLSIDEERVAEQHAKILRFADDRDCPVFRFEDTTFESMQRLWWHCVPGMPLSEARLRLLIDFNVQADASAYAGRVRMRDV